MNEEFIEIAYVKYSDGSVCLTVSCGEEGEELKHAGSLSMTEKQADAFLSRGASCIAYKGSEDDE